MERPDVLIVGAGPSGAVTALRLAQDGSKVTVLERIGYQGQRALPLGPPDHEDLLDSVVALGPVYRPTP